VPSHEAQTRPGRGGAGAVAESASVRSACQAAHDGQLGAGRRRCGMHAPCMLAADSVGESLRAAASSQTACCVPVHAVGCMQGCMQGACSTGRRVKSSSTVPYCTGPTAVSVPVQSYPCVGVYDCTVIELSAVPVPVRGLLLYSTAVATRSSTGSCTCRSTAVLARAVRYGSYSTCSTGIVAI
jgi:hypothetical protein